MDEIGLKGNDIKIQYSGPLNLYVLIPKEKFIQLKDFKWCKKIDIKNYDLTNDDINFLIHGTFENLEEINLDGNKITNLNIIDKIQSKKLKHISIMNNPINDGIIYINDKLHDLKMKKINVKIENNNHVLSLNYFDEKKNIK